MRPTRPKEQAPGRRAKASGAVVGTETLEQAEAMYRIVWQERGGGTGTTLRNVNNDRGVETGTARGT
jgi:hypothetical protein